MIKYKPKISELKKFRNILQKSIPHEDDSINNIIVEEKLLKKTKIKTKLINLNQCEKWKLDKNNNLYHTSGQFLKSKVLGHLAC